MKVVLMKVVLMKVVLMKVVFDEKIFDEIDHFHPNFDESVPDLDLGLLPRFLLPPRVPEETVGGGTAPWPGPGAAAT